MREVNDRERFEAAYKEYATRMVWTAFSALHDVALAQDAVQQAFLLMWEAWDRFDATRPFAPWGYRVLLNVVSNLRRSQGRIISLEDGDGTLLDTLAGPGPSPEAARQEAGRRLELLRSLETLTERQRTMLLLWGVEGLKYREIAEAMTCSLGTVMSTLAQSRRKVRAHLAARGLRP